MRTPPLSVLETASVPEGVPSYTTLADAVRLAETADRLGYHRFWVAEHHFSRHASSAPAVLLGHLAARTTRIRLGSGGVMLPNYPPLVVAEQFAMLEALCRGRIDLGVGGASGAPRPDAAFDEALGRRPDAAARYPTAVGDLLAYLHGRAALPVAPAVDPVPVIILATSVGGARLAAAHGLAMVFGHHLGRGDADTVLRAYRSAFTPSATLDRPRVIVSVHAICGTDDDAAEEAAVRVGLAQLRRTRAQETGATAEAGALAAPAADPRERFLARRLLSAAPTLVGGPVTVATGLVDLARRTAADELMVVPVEPDGEARTRTLRQIAAAYPPGGADRPAAREPVPAAG
jgi:luciferase family oxidoreductase group 1